MTSRNFIKAQEQVISLEPMLLMSASTAGDSSASIALDIGEVLHGTDEADTLIALVGNNELVGADGHDHLISVHGNNIIDGGDGHDVVQYWKTAAAADIQRQSDGALSVTINGRRDILHNIEAIQFDDGTHSVAALLNEPEYRSIDGTGNNLQQPDLGSTHEQLIRLSDAEYGDGISAPAGAGRPSAREISNVIVAQSSETPNSNGLTDLTWLWGQFIDHDIDLTEPHEPEESFDISVPLNDPWFDPMGTGEAVIALNRSTYDTEVAEYAPRQQTNEITAFIDGSMIYGSDTERMTELRTFEDGLLNVSDNNLLPFNESGLANAGGDEDSLFLAGDIRANENAALTSMHTLWVREHNRLAEELAFANPELTDEGLFQEARRLVVAQIQAITYREFLPALLGDSAPSDYLGYDDSADPTIANEFSTAAFRFGHTMLTSELSRLNSDGGQHSAGPLSLRDAFFAPDEITEHGIDPLLHGLSKSAASEIDTLVIDDVRNFLFGPPGAGGLDLASLNIQRGRDHGLADYNQVREDLGLARVAEFSQITSDAVLAEKLQNLYATVDDIDLWIGGLAEDHVDGASMGETFATIISDQFSRLRDGDRFWYEQSLSEEEIRLVEEATLSDVLLRNTSIDTLPDDVFHIA